MYNIFQTGQYKYKGIDKPVLFNDEFLSKISETYPSTQLNSVDEKNRHTNEQIGTVEGLSFNDGVLTAEKIEGTFEKDTKFSPSFDCNLIDKGNFYLAVDGKMVHIAPTKQPNQVLLNNSEIITERMDLGDEIKMDGKMADVISKKDQEIGDLRNKLETTKKKLESYGKFDKTSKDYENQIKSLEEQLKSATKENEEIKVLKEKADKFDETVKKQRERLIKEVVGDDPEMNEILGKFSIDELKVMKEKKIITEEPKGKIYNGNTSDGSEKPPTEDKFTMETYKETLKEYGLNEPHFDF